MQSLKKMNNLEEFLKVAIDLAKKSGQMMIEWRQKGSFKIDTKTSEKDLVTEADIKIEQFIFDSLRQKFPSHRFIGEESVTDHPKKLDSDDPTWIVDPIDGTMNFAHNSLYCCVSIGLAINREFVVGVINCPFLGKLYHATKGGGAKCNNIPIHVAAKSVTSLEKSLIISDIAISIMGIPKLKPYAEKLFESIVWKSQGMRYIGSCCISLCYVANGFADCYFTAGVKIWDMAAGCLIVREAGGVVFRMSGEEFDPNLGSIMASSNPILAKDIANRIKEAKKSIPSSKT